MTKKHYEAIAFIIDDETTTLQLEEGETVTVIWQDNLISRLSYYFATDNKNFDRSKFLDACGITE